MDKYSAPSVTTLSVLGIQRKIDGKWVAVSDQLLERPGVKEHFVPYLKAAQEQYPEYEFRLARTQTITTVERVSCTIRLQ